MADVELPEIEEPGGKKGGGLLPTIIAVVVITAVAGGGGALVGSLLGSSAPVPAAEAAEPAHEEPKSDGHGAESSDIAEAEESQLPLQLIELKPVLTNIQSPADAWLRIEASLVVQNDGTIEPEVLAAEIEADTLAFLRSVQLAQVEGSRGLLHLRDDLRHRAKLRSPAVVDYLIRTMVAE